MHVVGGILPGIEWGAAWEARPGEVVCGDMHLVHPVEGGALVAVVDGLGHGQEAASAARRAIDVVADAAHGSVMAIMRRCHESLSGTRGVVMNIARFDTRDDSMTWLGVGNVSGTLVRANPTAMPPRETVLHRAGVLGLQQPVFRAEVVAVTPGDTLLFATDGIHPGFALQVFGQRDPSRLAGATLTSQATGTDDALLLVARYWGRTA